MEFSEVLLNRRSCRKYTDEPVSDGDIRALLYAASLAPIGSNRTEDVHLTVVKSRDVLRELALAMNRRREDAEAMKNITEKISDPGARATAGFDPFYGAPVVIFVSHRRQDIQPGIEYCNVMSAASAMHLKATELGLGSVFMWGSLEAMRMYPEYDRTSLLELPEGFEPLIGLAVGHPASQPRPKAADGEGLGVNYIG